MNDLEIIKAIKYIYESIKHLSKEQLNTLKYITDIDCIKDREVTTTYVLNIFAALNGVRLENTPDINHYMQVNRARNSEGR